MEANAFGINYDAGTISFAFPAVDAWIVAAAGALPSSYDLAVLPGGAINGLADAALVPGSDHLTVDRVLYRRVDGMPKEGEYRIEGTKVYFDPDVPPSANAAIRVEYKYRNNQDGDLVVAAYSTKKLITVSVTVSKQDPAARNTRNARQDFRVVSRVEVHNTPE
jgi:hypothetical protein